MLMELTGDLLPPCVLNVVLGLGREAGEGKRITKIALTGPAHPQVRPKNIIPSTVALSGKSSSIIFEGLTNAGPFRAFEDLLLTFTSGLMSK
uniref:hypothetical protein n=1 Tax=Pseudomonas aestuarii TaxID=3018340 RepID=UPI0038CD1946